MGSKINIRQTGLISQPLPWRSNDLHCVSKNVLL